MIVSRTRKLLCFFTLSLLVIVSCKKKDDDEEEEEAAPTGSLMAKVDVSCGGENCFGDASKRREDSPIQTMRMFSWMIVGFPDSDSYDDTMQGNEDAQDLIPEDGMVSVIDDIRKKVSTAADSEGIKKCADAPSSGKIKMSNGTLTWAKPKYSSPDTFASEGDKYEKALTYVNKDETTEVRFEFFCKTQAMLAILSTLDDGDIVNKYAFYYERPSSKEVNADFFLIDPTGIINGGDGTLELAFMMHKSKTNLEAWVTRTGEESNGSLGYRYAINRSIADENLSYFITEVGTQNEGIATATWEAKDAVNSEAVSGGVASSTAGTSNDVFGPEQGCADGWDFVRSTQTSSDLCEDLDLSKGPTPAFDSDGDMSLGWVRANLESAIEDL